VEALRARFPSITGPRTDDICYATQNRQDAVKKLANRSDVVIVVGSQTSSNSNRLREVAEQNGARAYMLDRADELQAEWLQGAAKIGVTAGASAPEILVQDVIRRLNELGAVNIQELDGIAEHVSFPLPRGLIQKTE
jgi:4-hydroxy-3-methylbut-2-enyl diphosphate reductase